MKQYLNVRGTQDTVPNLEVNIDTVYVRNNIKRIETNELVGWEYDEIQYSLREYQELTGNKLETTNADVQGIAETTAYVLIDTMTTAETVAFLLLEIESLKAEIEVLKGGAI